MLGIVHRVTRSCARSAVDRPGVGHVVAGVTSVAGVGHVHARVGVHAAVAGAERGIAGAGVADDVAVRVVGAFLRTPGERQGEEGQDDDEDGPVQGREVLSHDDQPFCPPMRALVLTVATAHQFRPCKANGDHPTRAKEGYYNTKQ